MVISAGNIHCITELGLWTGEEWATCRELVLGDSQCTVTTELSIVASSCFFQNFIFSENRFFFTFSKLQSSEEKKFSRQTAQP